MMTMTKDLRKAVLSAFRRGLGDNNITFEEGYNFLLKRFRLRKWVDYIICYPDLVYYACSLLQEGSKFNDAETRSEILSLAVSRFKDNEAWQKYSVR